ncbi:Chaperone protein dnaj [Thalictrum thalictroides]|uniref:Chaperone protein dnaj n=1 Tax=Thalictrum thalictroides TaxID=46969 RepID=A0A7J6WZI2_THATH|nr:Chaperone protein dnaj [Thalictrum thalictroides]
MCLTWCAASFESRHIFCLHTMICGIYQQQQQRLNHHYQIKHQRFSSSVVASAAINSKQNHYHILGISVSASSVDIKKAYRLLARKYHPDVSKDSQAGEAFKSIRLAYEVLSNEKTRAQYDNSLKFRQDSGGQVRRNWSYDPEYEEGVRIYRWAELRRQMQREKYWQHYETTEDDSSTFSETEEPYEEEILDDERGSFSEVLKFAFVILFFMQTIGSQFTLMLCSLTALFDKKLDGGYKLGYLLAWILGGRGGVLLTLGLSFASWVCGKTSSSLVAVVVVAMWVGTNLARYAPLPQGALIALLYMSVKLQVDLS